MIRILHFVTFMGRGGLETLLMNYYRVIDREAIQFDFFTHRPWAADYDDEIKKLGGRIYYYRRLNPFSYRYRLDLGKFFDEHPEYKIIHVHQDCMSAVILNIAEKHSVKIRIAHSHSSSQTKDIKYPLKLIFKRFIPRYATHLLACSEAAGKWMFDGAPFSVLPNAIDASKYRFDAKLRKRIRENYGIDENTVVIGHVGRFEAPKNHLFLLDIFNEVVRRCTAKLLLVGDGKYHDEIVNKINELDLASEVIMTGIRSDVEDLMQAMDVFVLPSLYEGMPMTLIEAQASGLPCLISDKVPIECKITDYVHQIPLSVGADKWAQYAIEASEITRKDTYEQICKAGFDVVNNTDKLTVWYQQLSKEETEI